MRSGQIVPYPTLRERPRKMAAVQRRFAGLMAPPRAGSRLMKALQLAYAIGCVLVVAISLAAIAGLP